MRFPLAWRWILPQIHWDKDRDTQNVPASSFIPIPCCRGIASLNNSWRSPQSLLPHQRPFPTSPRFRRTSSPSLPRRRRPRWREAPASTLSQSLRQRRRRTTNREEALSCSLLGLLILWRVPKVGNARVVDAILFVYLQPLSYELS